MRRIVRYCANCDLQGVRTELGDDEPDVTIIIDRYGAHTDLCGQCQATLLGPVLQVMATGIGLAELTLTDWAKLGGQVPSTRSIRSLQRQAQPESASTTSASTSTTGAFLDGQVFACKWCGQEFDKPSSLDRHLRFKGDGPHEPSARAKAAAGAGSNVPYDGSRDDADDDEHDQEPRPAF
jgi:hypothetical protein